MQKKKIKTFDEINDIFYPKSIAVVGTNNVKGSVPYDIFENILHDRFQGILYPVSPSEKNVGSIKAYKYVVDIEDDVDMAILVFPSSVAHLAMEQIGKKGIKSAIIISAGFKEVGAKGFEKERKIKEIADKYGISFIGPNCLGVINTDPMCHMDASFARAMPEEGNIAFISQSGALCTAVLDYANAKHIGFSKFVSFGNKADVDEIDLLYYLKDDPKTKVILMYLEEVTNGKELMKAARIVTEESGKPILAIKSGRTTEGASAAASHTGSLAGSDEITNAAFEQAGIIRCENLEEMFDYAKAFAYQPLPKSKNIAIITNAGGPGVLATDKAISSGLSLGKFNEDTTKILKKSLPAAANIKNPVDVIGDARADRYNVAISAAIKDKNIDGVNVILTPQSMTEIEDIAKDIVKVVKQSDIPVYTSFMGETDVSAGINILQQNNIPHYFLPENMVKSMAETAKFFERINKKIDLEVKIFNDVNKPKATEILNKAIADKKTYLPEEEAVKVLEAYNFPVLPNGLANSKDEAGEIANNIKYPVVMKIISSDIVHKFDTGGVILNIQNREEAESAYKQILKNVKKVTPDAEIKGVFVQKMVEEGQEVILGLKKDNSFGSVIMFGLGGIFVEIFKDVDFKVAPISENEVDDMIQSIRSYPILKGARGSGKRDVKSLKETIMRLSQLAIDCPQIKELDINPLIVRNEGKGCFVADTKIML
ncbi:MAG: acetate--CoA ligase family protein [Candidatus Marinimicrobia bacterium]|nr:acetate--CoA ligase family protein [Candidatus Neomarinimicrobiota bacterium]